MTTTAVDDRSPEPEEIEPTRFARPGPPRPEVSLAREDDPPADVPRDQWDRPLIVLPDGSDVIAYIRASKYGKIIEDYYALHRWDERNIVFGMSRGHHLVVKAQAVTGQTGKENIGILQDVAERAKVLAGADAGAMTGTGLHLLSVRRDAGEDLSYLDPLSMAALDAYAGLLSPFEVLATETFVVCDELGGAGSFDRVIRLRFPLVWPDGIVWPAGMIVVIDVKTGKVSSAPFWACDFTCQQLIYATGQPYLPGRTELEDPSKRSAGNIVRVTDQPGVNGRIGWDAIGVPGGPSQRWALICHVPALDPSQAQWERVDLDVAREDADAARRAWARNRVSRADRFLALPAAALVPPDGIALAGTDDGIRGDIGPVDTALSTEDVAAAKAATAAANREQTTATLLARIRRADSTDKIDQLYDAWGTSAAWTDELTDACQAAYDRLSPPEDVAECDGCNYDQHLCPACGVGVAHGVVACAACSLRIDLDEAPDLVTLDALWLAHGPAGDGLWSDEHSAAAQAAYERLEPPDEPPADAPADAGPVPPESPGDYPFTITYEGWEPVTLWCHECLLPVGHPQVDDPVAWCDCTLGEDCFDAAVSCRNRAHGADECRHRPASDRVFQGPDDDPAGPPAFVHSPGPAGSPEAPEQPDPADERARYIAGGADDQSAGPPEQAPPIPGATAPLLALIVEVSDEATLIALYERHKPVSEGGDGLWDDECSDAAQAVYDRMEREQDLSHGPVPDGGVTS